MTQITSNSQSRLKASNEHGDWEDLNAPSKTSVLRTLNKKVLTILLIGETGSGKTSFMSLLLNLFEGNGPFELKDKHVDEDQSGLDKSKSQTTWARIYTFTTSDGHKIKIIDTPGLADTRGMDEDKRHKERIHGVIQELATEIDSVMIVANGTIERLSLAMDYTMNTLATWFPRSILPNIGILFTNVSAAGAGLNFQTESLPLELREVEYWCLNNPLSLFKSYAHRKATGSFARNRESAQRSSIESTYHETLSTLDDWLEWLDERKSIPTSAIIDLYQKSSHIEACLFRNIMYGAELSKFKDQLSAVTQNLDSIAKKKERNKALQQTLSPTSWVLKETSDYNTICIFSDCHTNCHTSCSLEVGDTEHIGGSCRVFKTLRIPNKWLPFWSNEKVKCGQSECKHEAQSHRHYRQIHQQVENESYKQIAEELGAATANNGKLEDLKTSIQIEIETISRSAEESKQEILRLVDELNCLSLSPNYAGYIQSALYILSMRKVQLMSRTDSASEMETIKQGIEAFEAHLELLRAKEAGRVVEAST
ncbi:AIG1 domain-containing protein [Rhizoctonia solani]|uniref:AIG1 domain-containing protein n=1 Tax=Rhizoctonia solani TaxID=456999 RepID=A0A8H8P067_9AGAM|nr:AIG1 domain-containing protein [Rhizoctonia solani]QRW23119.1 AIG1 domain-containing protein [Rhizoctonia solani]